MQYKPFNLSYFNDVKQIIMQGFGNTLVFFPHRGDSDFFNEMMLLKMFQEMTYSQIAINNEGKVVGLLFGEEKGQALQFPQLQLRVQFYFHLIKMFMKMIFSKQFRIGVKNLQSMIAAYEELVKDFSYESQVLLFAVNNEYRGQGVGKMLMNNFLDEMYSKQYEYVILLTDNACTYQFYDNNGYSRIKTKTISFTDDSKLECYLYQKNLNKKAG